MSRHLETDARKLIAAALAALGAGLTKLADRVRPPPVRPAGGGGSGPIKPQ